ncbi:type 1 glutamine amidotransferase [Neogemmobacter tilapiae]|uniref:GMP synthase n=1 Tax=Neogemmobacter tilapiae TaxID=875041 RepID=A0A918TGC9_9RHOB|nr:type 1 glutamine amidotransferase [Gemmobacter tilapiae]GHC45226.1 GMP synthase [Gemmobacter tilapiae]
MRIAIIENTAVTHHGQVGVALHERAALVDQFRPFAGQSLPFGPHDHDALIVFGGEQSARDDAAHPYLGHLADLMGKFHAADKPVLGICLGAQLLARAFGAENRLGGSPEFGWTEITLTEQGRTDPVLSRAGDQFRAFQWHSDTFTLPQGAALLATGPVPQQAFRLGRATYGMQFHFEANRAMVADWTRRFPEGCERMQPGWAKHHADQAAQHGAAADAAGLKLARAWLDLV